MVAGQIFLAPPSLASKDAGQAGFVQGVQDGPGRSLYLLCGIRGKTGPDFFPGSRRRLSRTCQQSWPDLLATPDLRAQAASRPATAKETRVDQGAREARPPSGRRLTNAPRAPPGLWRLGTPHRDQEATHGLLTRPWRLCHSGTLGGI